MAREEVVLPFPAPRASIAPATHYRSTWIVSSLQALRNAGHYERYLELLPAGSRDEIVNVVAGIWLPMPVAKTHYVACDRLGLDVDQQIGMGLSVGERAQGTLLSTVVRAARGAGVTPWTIFPQFHRLWQRGCEGGAAAVTKLGPKDARAEFIGLELMDIDYFRNAFRGVVHGVVALFCKKLYVHEEPRRARGEVAFHVQWA